MYASLFMRLSALVTVAELANSLQASVSAESTLADAQDHIDRHRLGFSEISLVVEEGETVGWVDESLLYTDEEPSDVEPQVHVRDIMQIFDPTRLLTADTPAQRALKLVANGDPFEPRFVLDGHEFIGTLDYDCFFKPPFRICLFALAMQLEQQSLRLCAQKPKRSWDALSDGRRTKALNAMRRRREQLPSIGLGEEIDDLLATETGALLGCTTFIDKKTIICKLGLLPTVPDAEIRTAFDWMESIRNFCAHPDTYEEPFIEPQDLVERITACEKLLQAIEDRLLPPAPAET